MRTESSPFLKNPIGPADYQFSRKARQNRVEQSKAARVAEAAETGSAAKTETAAKTSAAAQKTTQTTGQLKMLLDPPLILAIQSNLEIAPRLNGHIAPLSVSQTHIERLYDQRHPSFDYGQVVSNPATAMQEHEASYQEFLTEAGAVIEQMEEMDNTSLLEMRFTVSGPQADVSDRLKDLMNQPRTPAVARQIDAALATRDRINSWLANNTAHHDAIAEKGAAYAFAAAAQNYEAETGLDRDAAMNAGADEGNSFHLSVARAAYNQYGLNPLTAAESTERYGEAGAFSFARR